MNTPAPDLMSPTGRIIPLSDMTSAQLARRAKIIEEVIDLIGEVGADAVQMRDVAQRSEVALATLYRYFSSKENLLAAALADWQKRLTRRMLSGGGPADTDPLPAVFGLPAPRPARVQPQSGHDRPDAADDDVDRSRSACVDRSDGAHQRRVVQPSAGRRRARADPAGEFRPQRRTERRTRRLARGRLTLDESLSHVEWVARVLLAEAQHA